MYTVSVYRYSNSNKKPWEQSTLLYSGDFAMRNTGYDTLYFPDGVTVNNGERIAVVLSRKDGEEFQYTFETSTDIPYGTTDEGITEAKMFPAASYGGLAPIPAFVLYTDETDQPSETVPVEEDPPATEIITDTDLTIVVGQTCYLGTMLHTGDYSLQTSNASIAYVGGGSVAGKSAGDAIITASTNGKIIATIAVTVEKPTLPAKKTVQVGKKLDLTKLLKGTTLKPTSWKSSKKSVAKVNNKGMLKAKKAGKTVITAKINGQSFTMTVVVR